MLSAFNESGKVWLAQTPQKHVFKAAAKPRFSSVHTTFIKDSLAWDVADCVVMLQACRFENKCKRLLSMGLVIGNGTNKGCRRSSILSCW